MSNGYFAQHEHDPKKVASLIYFKEGVDIERVKAWIAKLEAAGFVEGSTTREYQEAFGSPVWYIP